MVQKNFSLEIPKAFPKFGRNFLDLFSREIPWNWLREIPQNGLREIPRNGLQEIPRNGLGEITRIPGKDSKEFPQNCYLGSLII